MVVEGSLIEADMHVSNLVSAVMLEGEADSSTLMELLVV